MSHPLPDVKEQMKSSIYSVLIAYYLVQKINFGQELSNDLNTLMNDKLFLFLVGFVEKNNQVQLCNTLGTHFPSQDEEPLPILYSLTPAFAFFNHSCIQMIHRVRRGDHIVITCLSPIKKGEQVFDSYGVNFIRHEKSLRTPRLSDLCVFCDCKACINDWPNFPDCIVNDSGQNKTFLLEIINNAGKFKNLNTDIVRSNNKLLDVSKVMNDNLKLVEKTHRRFMEKNSVQNILSTVLLVNAILSSSMPFFCLDSK